jgi:hypothetical protein
MSGLTQYPSRSAGEVLLPVPGRRARHVTCRPGWPLSGGRVARLLDDGHTLPATTDIRSQGGRYGMVGVDLARLGT